MSANFKETQKTLNSFAKYVIQQSRSNLSKQKKNVSSSLYGSLGYDLSFSHLIKSQMSKHCFI